MEHATPLPFLRETLLFLTLTGVLIPLLQRWRVNQVIGFLVIGVVVGPYGAGSLTDSWPWLSLVTIPRRQGVEALAELGVIFLMFLIGLELSLQRMWALRRWVFGVGSAQVVFSALAIAGMAHVFGNEVKTSLVLGLVLSLSSTAVVMQLLTQQRTLATPLGQAAFSVLMLQDLAVVPLLIVVDVLSQEHARGALTEMLTEILTRGAISVAVVAVILVVGRKVVGPLFRTFAQQRQSEVFMALTLLVALSIAGATAMAGVSMALGAFLAGLLLGETEYRHEVEVTIEPFKGLLMGLFFMSVGMGIDVREVAQDPGWVLMSVAGLLVIKSVIASVLLRLGGLRWGEAVEGGTLLSQGGEFAFIVIGVAISTELLSARVGQFMLLVVSLSLLATPLWARVGKRIGRLWQVRPGSGPTTAHADLHWPMLQSHVVVIGCGRVGQLLCEVFSQQEVPYLGIEHDVERVSALRAQGAPVFYGNATRPDLLGKLGLDRAACLVVTMDQAAAARRVVRQVRQAHPNLPIYARSHDEAHAKELRAAGATMVVPETLEAGLLLTGRALGALGVQPPELQAIVQAERERRLSVDSAA
jgi:CPA2 family monovalent cation:H+ antiporter-2